MGMKIMPKFYARPCRSTIQYFNYLSNQRKILVCQEINHSPELTDKLLTR